MSIFIYGDNIDTDLIIPARYLYSADPAELAAKCFIDFDDSFSKTVKKGDIIVAGENFGCGSSREHAPIAIRASGVSVVIAKSFARIFFRNAINIGLAIIECPDAVSAVKKGSQVSADPASGKITVDGRDFFSAPMPDFIQGIIRSGGLLESLSGGVKNA